MNKFGVVTAMYFLAAAEALAPDAATAATVTDQFNICSDALSYALPARAAGAESGSEFVNRIHNLSGIARDNAIAEAVRSGNVPDFLRDLQPVVMNEGTNGDPEIIVCAMPDYLAIGSDTDYVRVPMGLPASLSVATEFGFMLPTRKIVDAVYNQADTQISPSPMTPGPSMESTGYFATHNDTIERQLERQGTTPGALTAGHKKDLVVSPRIWNRDPADRPRVAIYGWHQSADDPIQPLSTVHGENYADYSHGVRLISSVVFVDGVPASLYEALADPNMSGYLSDEGAVSNLDDRVEAIIDRPVTMPDAMRHYLTP